MTAEKRGQNEVFGRKNTPADREVLQIWSTFCDRTEKALASPRVELLTKNSTFHLNQILTSLPGWSRTSR